MHFLRGGAYTQVESQRAAGGVSLSVHHVGRYWVIRPGSSGFGGNICTLSHLHAHSDLQLLERLCSPSSQSSHLSLLSARVTGDATVSSQPHLLVPIFHVPSLQQRVRGLEDSTD